MKSCLFSRFYIGVYTVLMFLTFAAKAEAPASGPNGGTLITSDQGRVEVKLDQNAKKVDVYLLESGPEKPTKLSLILTSESGINTPLSLNRVQTKGLAPLYRSDLPDTKQTFVGLMLQLDFAGAKTKRYKAKLK